MMNINFPLFFFALLQLALSLFVGVVILFICFRFINRFSKKSLHLERQNNEAFAILVASALFSVGYLMETIIHPLMTTIRLSLNKKTDMLVSIAKSLGYFGVYFVISSIFSFLLVIISYRLFVYITDVFWGLNEMEEIKKNNLSIGIITGVIVIVMAMLCRDGLELLVESIIPFPALNKTYN